MTKKIFYIFTCICALFINLQHTGAQTSCDNNYTVSAAVTPSTCVANGTVTVTLEGDVSGISNVQYGLSSASGFTIQPQSNNVLSNIPPGTYTLTVRAFCTADGQYGVTKSVSNLVIENNYQTPQATLNSSHSRKSYQGCTNLGIIALSVAGGNGPFTFNIVAAPAGVTLGPVTAAKAADDPTVYILSGENYPAGIYTINVVDDGGCGYTASANFDLSLSGMPTLAKVNAFVSDINTDTQGACNYAGLCTNSTDAALNSDWLTYLNDGLYEIAVAEHGAGMPDDTPGNWVAWTNYGDLYYYVPVKLPGAISNYYSSDAPTLDVYVRVKGCPNVFQIYPTGINPPSMYNLAPVSQTIHNCDDTYTLQITGFYEGTELSPTLCFPLTISIWDYTTNSEAFHFSSWWDNTRTPLGDITLLYDHVDSLIVTDSEGIIEKVPIFVSSDSYFGYANYQGSSLDCDGYISTYQFVHPWGISGKTVECELPITVTITGSDGFMSTQTFTTIDEANSAATPLLKYDVTYTVEAQYSNVEKQPNILILSSSLPEDYTLAIVPRTDTYGSCDDNTGCAIITATTGRVPAGTTLTITGPAGTTPIVYNVTEDNVSNSYGSNIIEYLPPGDYTLTVSGCGQNKTATVYNPGLYSYTDFGYTQKMTCNGLEITPTGTITFAGAPDPESALTTWYKIEEINNDGNVVYSATVRAGDANQTLFIHDIGTYRLSMGYHDDCAITSKTFDYAPLPFSLDPNATSAYVCVGDATGNIIINGINGVTPYTYELWDKDNTTELNATAEIADDGSARFIYGQAGETYTVRIADACGAQFSQPVTLVDLQTPRIIYAAKTTVCAGDSIELHCITLGKTSYSWTGPNGFVREDDQNPVIENADASMTGWYTVSVTPEYCGKPVTDQIYITVKNCSASTYVPVNPQLMNKAIK